MCPKEIVSLLYAISVYEMFYSQVAGQTFILILFLKETENQGEKGAETGGWHLQAVR